MRGLSVFSGVGGLDLGARLAGIDVVLAADIDDTALQCLHTNQGTNVSRMDLIDFASGAREPVNDVDIVFGGPPCTPFSHAGFWLAYKRNGEVGRRTLLDAFLKVLDVARPDGFVMENVPGLAFNNHKMVLTDFMSRARSRGFCVSTFTVNASDCGVPQSRRRFFVVGGRSDGAFQFTPVRRQDLRTSGWAFADLTGDKNPPRPRKSLQGSTKTCWPSCHQGQTISTSLRNEVIRCRSSHGGVAIGRSCLS